MTAVSGRAYRVEFTPARAGAARLVVEIGDVHTPAELPAKILEQAQRMFSIARLPRQVTVSVTTGRGRLIAGAHTCRFTLTEIRTGPLVCTACDQPYDHAPAWLAPLLRPGMCWSCS